MSQGLPRGDVRRALRYGARVTLAEAAAEIGVSAASVHYYEKGRRPRDAALRGRYAALLERWAHDVGVGER